MNEPTTITWEQDGHVGRVTLNRPDRMNAMAFDVMIPLRDALRDISTDNECRVVVLTGTGSVFSAGCVVGLLWPSRSRRPDRAPSR